MLALPHGVDARAQADGVGKLKELGERDLIEPLAREVHEQPRLLARQALETPGIALEQLLHRHRRETRGVGAQVRPHRRARTGTCGGWHEALRLIWSDLSSSITPLPRVFFTMMDLTQQTRARATRRAGSHGDDGSY